MNSDGNAESCPHEKNHAKLIYTTGIVSYRGTVPFTPCRHSKNTLQDKQYLLKFKAGLQKKPGLFISNPAQKMLHFFKSSHITTSIGRPLTFTLIIVDQII